MYEDYTYDEIMTSKMAKVNEIYPGIDVRPGSLIYTACAPDSLEEAMIYSALDVILAQTFASSADRAYLILRAADRNMSPIAATYAVIEGVFTFSGSIIPELSIGSTYTAGNYTWAISEKVDAYHYLLKCTTAGSDPNHVTIGDRLLPVSSVSGLSSATIQEISILGEDEEDTETFRARYLASFKNSSYGFNRAQYIEVIGALDGVGLVKPFRASKVSSDNTVEHNHPGHVAIFITDSDYGVPTDALIDSVQTTIDPTQNQGDGMGLAPIDHEVHIAKANMQVINISADFTFVTGITFDDCKDKITAAITTYLHTLNKLWTTYTNLTVRKSQIESAIISLSDYIVDVQNTKINGGTDNLVLGETYIAQMGTVTKNS